MNKRSVGSIYEQLAAEQLINMGYSVLACNYRNRFGEIDIIAKDGDTICFCEVKVVFCLIYTEVKITAAAWLLKQLVIASRKKLYQLQGIIL